MENSDLIHLYNRVGFGILPQDLKAIKDMNRKDHVKMLLKKSKQTTELKIDTSSLKKFDTIKDKIEKRMKIQKENRKLLIQLNVAWYHQLYNSKTLLHDKMRLFWANHFVCHSNLIHPTEDYLKVIEKHALGNFKDFVIAISKNPMMLFYLNNQQNRKEHPNENYARELMELFTLGVGNYTEKDIKESARAFTGWSANRKRSFIFRKQFHDFGEKTFLGKTGNFDGNDIIDIILDQPQCALFICEKIYKEFVNPVPNKTHIQKMAKVFRKKYQIDDLMEYTLNADWFYDEKNKNVKIKSPVELIVGIHNIMPFELKRYRYFQYLQYNLGQKLLNPPNVAGWPGDKHWIDANTIMIRLKLTSAIAQQKAIEMEPESAFEDDFEMISKRKQNRAFFVFTSVNWDKFNQEHQNTELEEWQKVLLGSKISNKTKEVIKSINNNTPRDFCIALMSLPEYQMC